MNPTRIQPGPGKGGLLSRAVRLWQELRLVAGERIRYAPLILGLILISTALDLIGVALIAPYIALLLGDDSLISWLPSTIRGLLGDDPTGRLSILLVTLFLSKAIAALIVTWTISRLAESIRVSLIGRLLETLQHRSYLWFLDQNSSNLVNQFTWYTQAFSVGFLAAGLRLISDILLFVFLGSLILAVNWVAFLMLLVAVSMVFIGVPWIVKSHASRLTQTMAKANGQLILAVQQAIGGLREIRIIGCEDYFKQRAIDPATSLARATAGYQVLSVFPRHVVEITMVTFLVALVAVSRASTEVGTALLPLLGVIGASAVRLMPAATSLLSNFNSWRANRFVVASLAEALSTAPSIDAKNQCDREKPGPEEAFRSLELAGVGFSYNRGDRFVFRDINLLITAGDTVGLMGPSGVGKSTLVDIILGLISPTTGTVWINGRPLDQMRSEWQSRVAYIPQTPYLIDDTLRRNIAFGVPDSDVDDELVLESLRSASLESFVSCLEQGLDTEIGERGVRMSGGQRQRVSIARALYHDRELFVLDEATSALDSDTESEILETIANLSGRKTMIIIAHRESTLVSCNRRLELSPGVNGAVLT